MGGSSGNNKTTTTQNSEPWSSQIPYLEYGMREAKNLYRMNGPDYYSGNTVAGFSPEQEQAFKIGRERALNGNETVNMAEKYNQDVLSGKYSGDPYEGQVFQNIQQKIMPSVNSQFMGSGRYGSGMQADSAARGMTEAFAPYASSMYQQSLQRMDDARNASFNFAANDYNDLAALEAIGKQRQGLAQSEIDDAVNRWNYYQQLPYNKLGQYLNNIGGNYGGTVIGTTKTPNTSPSMFQQVAGTGLQLLGTLGSLGVLSDIRAKEDIRRVGAMDDGTPIYAYRYIGSPVTQFGVMAQEVEKRHPEAVMTRPDGLKAVDYAALADAVVR